MLPFLLTLSAIVLAGVAVVLTRRAVANWHLFARELDPGPVEIVATFTRDRDRAA